MVIWFIGFKIIGKFYLKLLSLTPTVSRRKIHRMCPDCPSSRSSPIDLSDPSVLEAATESLAKYNKESPLKLYSLVKVTRASSQVRLKCPLPPIVCLRTCYRFLNWKGNIEHFFWLEPKRLSSPPTLVDWCIFNYVSISEWFYEISTRRVGFIFTSLPLR